MHRLTCRERSAWGVVCAVGLLLAVVTHSVSAADEGMGSQASDGPSLYPGFRGYAREVTTESPEAQRWFDQGIQLLYGFNHDEAIRSFEKAAQIDPLRGFHHLRREIIDRYGHLGSSTSR